MSFLEGSGFAKHQEENFFAHNALTVTENNTIIIRATINWVLNMYHALLSI